MNKDPTLELAVHEKNDSTLESALREAQLELDPSSGHVRWTSKNPRHPRNWSLARKIWDIGIITLLEVYTYVESPITASIPLLIITLLEQQLVHPEYDREFSSD